MLAGLDPDVHEAVDPEEGVDETSTEDDEDRTHDDGIDASAAGDAVEDDEAGDPVDVEAASTTVDESRTPLTVTVSGPAAVFLVVADGTIAEADALAPQTSGQTMTFSNHSACPAVISVEVGGDLNLGPYALRVRYDPDVDLGTTRNRPPSSRCPRRATSRPRSTVPSSSACSRPMGPRRPDRKRSSRRGTPSRSRSGSSSPRPRAALRSSDPPVEPLHEVLDRSSAATPTSSSAHSRCAAHPHDPDPRDDRTGRTHTGTPPPPRHRTPSVPVPAECVPEVSATGSPGARPTYDRCDRSDTDDASTATHRQAVEEHPPCHGPR